MTLRVKGYDRTTKTGQVVHVDAYTAARDAAQEIMSMDPSRPPLAGKPGQFPKGRGTPGVFPKPVKPAAPKVPSAKTVKEFERAVRKQDAEHEKKVRDAGFDVSPPNESVGHLKAKGYSVKPSKPKEPETPKSEEDSLTSHERMAGRTLEDHTAERRRASTDAAIEVLRHASEAESQTTSTLIDAVSRHGGEMTGLQYRLKTQESLERKIHDKSIAKGITPEEYGGKVADSLRYTALFEPKNYVRAAQDTLSSLEAEGHAVVSVENSWETGDGYSGVNVELQAPNGLRWELQFHTPDSIRVKEESHKIYDIVRDNMVEFERREREYQRMVRLWDDVEQPPGWESFGTILFRDDAPKRLAMSNVLLMLARHYG